MRKIIRVFGFLVMAILLLIEVTSAAEKVFFYYTDPAGTPLAMTDGSGAVVWRADYKPFGEEKSITGTIENNEKFVGKEKDKETGLYYFGARYMKAEIGRFTSPDPVGPVDAGTSKTNYSLLTNPQKLNRYAYSLNNPYRYVDPNGKWPEEVHNSIIKAAFPKLPPGAIIAMQKGSAYADTFQDPQYSYMHAMRAPKQSTEDAAGLTDTFIMWKAAEYKTLMSQGKTDAAYEALGMAMHPLMDSTSPSHEGYQEWAGKFPVIDGTTKNAIIHWYQETERVFNMNPEYSKGAVDAIRKLYNEANR